MVDVIFWSKSIKIFLTDIDKTFTQLSSTKIVFVDNNIG